MSTRRRALLLACLILPLASILMPGCEGSGPREETRPEARSGDKDKSPVTKAESRKKEIAKNVFLEVLPDKKRRVLVNAEVCLREGQLEQLLCRRHTKEHEAILTADVDARTIHAGLIAAGAKEGSPVRFVPEYRPASGNTIKVSVQYKDKDKLVTALAQSWIKRARDNKPLESDWVFAGSRFVKNPLDPDGKEHYLANDGDVICISNFETALLDLPIKSPKDNADLAFVANTDRIPPLGTQVVVILEPVLEAKNDKK